MSNYPHEPEGRGVHLLAQLLRHTLLRLSWALGCKAGKGGLKEVYLEVPGLETHGVSTGLMPTELEGS